MRQNSIFISYRRNNGATLARVVQGWLEHNGFEVFMDVDKLAVGRFDAQIAKEIEDCDAVVLILSEGALDRIGNAEDWMRHELLLAMQHRKQIIPIAAPDFKWPASELPAELSELRLLQNIQYDHLHWLSIRAQLLAWLRPEFGAETPETGTGSVASVLTWWNALSIALTRAFLLRHPEDRTVRSAKEQIARLQAMGVLRPSEALQFDRLRRIRNQIVYSRASNAAVEIAIKENACFERMSEILIDALSEAKDRA